MHFQHSPQIWHDFPELVPGVMFVKGVRAEVRVDEAVTKLHAIAQSRLATSSEGDLPESQAWRRAFSRMGLKPTQYRCAAESLLRRFKKDGTLPRIHPLIDLCNAASLAFAIPVAVFDVSAIAERIEVRRAIGDERYLSFAGEVEYPDAGEVIFADGANQAHARRWSHRQSGDSAIRTGTTDALLVAEGMHVSAAEDVRRLLETLASALTAAGMSVSASRILSAAAREFAC